MCVRQGREASDPGRPRLELGFAAESSAYRIANCLRRLVGGLTSCLDRLEVGDARGRHAGAGAGAAAPGLAIPDSEGGRGSQLPTRGAFAWPQSDSGPRSQAELERQTRVLSDGLLDALDDALPSRTGLQAWVGHLAEPQWRLAHPLLCRTVASVLRVCARLENGVAALRWERS